MSDRSSPSSRLCAAREMSRIICTSSSRIRHLSSAVAVKCLEHRTSKDATCNNIILLEGLSLFNLLKQSPDVKRYIVFLHSASPDSAASADSHRPIKYRHPLQRSKAPPPSPQARLKAFTFGGRRTIPVLAAKGRVTHRFTDNADHGPIVGPRVSEEGGEGSFWWNGGGEIE